MGLMRPKIRVVGWLVGRTLLLKSNATLCVDENFIIFEYCEHICLSAWGKVLGAAL